MLSKNIYHFTLLLLISCFYLASKPVYFSSSATSFSWVNFSLGAKPLYENALWWLITMSCWLVLILPFLFYIYKRNKTYVGLYFSALCLPLALGIIRLWQPEWVMELLTTSLYYLGLALLISLYAPQFNNQKIRKAVHICLFSYIFIWSFQAIGHNILVTTTVVTQIGGDYPSLSYIGSFLLNQVTKLAHLLPVILVLILSMGKAENNGKTPATMQQSPEQKNHKAKPGPGKSSQSYKLLTLQLTN